MELEFEWDEDKARTNLTKHGVSFLTAAEIFANEIMERIDDREDYGGSLDCPRQGRYAGLPNRIHLAQPKPHPHHQRPESEQR